MLQDCKCDQCGVPHMLIYRCEEFLADFGHVILGPGELQHYLSFSLFLVCKMQIVVSLFQSAYAYSYILRLTVKLPQP